ncbi:hypothetical protein Srufu_018120 [Streptomyces libani subsp. rufus]|nr:hypothetical protein Srufu_018120 [Streptomyces libani subsp. rufus]
MRLRHRHSPLRGIARPAALAAAALLVITVPGPAQAAPPQPPRGATEFRSSFESGEPQPDWTDTVETGPDGKPRTSGVSPETTPATPGMNTGTDTGPRDSPTAKAHAGFTGGHALRYAGTHTAVGQGYSYNKIFDVNLPVAAATSLSYKIYPEMAKSDPAYPATHTAVDLAFTDGTYLSELSAVDQHGAPLTPRGQAAAKTLYANQWNNREARIGAVAAGKTVDRILVGYDAPAAPRTAPAFRGWIDDLTLAPKAPDKPLAHYSDYAVTTRGTLSSGSFSRGNTFPATAVPNGFNFWTPVTNAGSADWLYEYARKNNADNLPTLQAFSASHEPSPWMGDRQTFQVMPSAAAGTPDASRTGRALPFHHDNETARPHYYGVTFDNGLKTEITPTDHAALMRFTFPGDRASLIFDNVNNKGGLSLDTERGIVTGFSDVKSGLSVGATRLFVYASFDAPVTGGGRLEGGAGRTSPAISASGPGRTAP